MDTGQRLSQLTSKLRESGCRITPQRMLILNILAQSENHPCVEDIYQQVKKDFPMTSLGTVYKTVELLKDMGEVLELGFAHHSSRYDGHNPHPHPHAVCIKCQRIIDLDVNIEQNLTEQVAMKTGFQAVQPRLDFYGVCPECQKKA